MKRFAILLTMLGWISSGYGQTTLAQVYSGLRSPDPKIRDAASRASINLLDQEFPKIEAETEIICSGLNDANEAIRTDSSAILSTISYIHRDKDSVVSACLPQLLKTARDPVDQIRLNSLAALAMKADGPPAGAAPVFEAALSDNNVSVQQLGATGILKLPSGSNTSGLNLLSERLSREQNPEAKRALLLGAVQAQKTNPELAQAASRLIVDPDPGVQGAAIFAVEALNSDKSRALNELESYKTSQLLNPQTKPKLDSTINRLQAATH